MIYPYECLKCGEEFEVIKSVKDIDKDEHCPTCSGPGERFIAKSQFFYGANDWDTAHYNPAFGKVIKNNAEARKEARRLGMDEVGNEPVEKIHKKFDTERKLKSKKRWNEAFSSSLGEIKTK